MKNIKEVISDVFSTIKDDPESSELFTEEGKKELEQIVKEINNIAVDIVEDYANIPPDGSGSVIFVHQESPLLDNESTELSESISIGIHHTKEELSYGKSKENEKDK